MSLAPLGKGDSVYLVTPMRGRTMEEVRAQAQPIEERLRKSGLIVFSPSEKAEEENQEYGNPEHDFAGFAWDFDRVREVDALVLLEGWEHSSGGMLEITIANNLGTRVLEYSTWAPPVEKPGAIINYRDLPAPIAAAMLKIVSTFTRKNADYADDTNWRSNFDDIAAQTNMGAQDAAEVFIAVKQARLKSLRRNGREKETMNEAIEDTLLDRMVYCVIAYALMLDDTDNG